MTKKNAFILTFFFMFVYILNAVAVSRMAQSQVILFSIHATVCVGCKKHGSAKM